MGTEESKEADLESQRQNPISNGPSPVEVAAIPAGRRPLITILSFAVRLVGANWALVRSLAASFCREALDRIESLTFFQIALRLLILVVSISVIQEVCNNNPVLDVVNVPEQFQKQGYTPDVLARRIKDQITEIDTKEKVIEQHRLLQLATDSPLPDLQIPTANVSLKTAILFVRQLLRFPPVGIMVDVMVDYPTADKESTAADNESTGVKINRPDSRIAQLKIVVRRGDKYFIARESFSTLDPEKVLSSLAQDVMDEVDPYVLGVYVFDNNGAKDSEPHFKKATELDPTDARAFFAWGFALGSQGKNEEAIAEYRKVIDLDPKYAAAYNDWGVALDDKGKHDEAIAKYQQAIDLDPKYADAYDNWGTALYYQGRLDEAIAKYQQAIDLDPKYAAAYNNWGIVLAAQDKRDEAIAKYQKAIELEPQNELYRFHLEEALRVKRSEKQQ
jgi:tetratricopeptide (TPR) repeat protein